jgi:hypothetical protein
MEKLLRIDEHSEADVMEMIEWVRTHYFWSSVILSPEKLRKHFQTMVAQGSKNSMRFVSPPERQRLQPPSSEEFERETERRTLEAVPMPQGFKREIFPTRRNNGFSESK